MDRSGDDTMSKRKPFQELPSEQHPEFLQDGKYLYLYLKEKYPKETVENLDNILNGLCAGMICLIRSSVSYDDYNAFLQLIHKILSDNLRNKD